MNREKIVKTSLIVGSIGALIYGSGVAYNAYKLYRKTKRDEIGIEIGDNGNSNGDNSNNDNAQHNYEQKYINDFIRKISRISK